MTRNLTLQSSSKIIERLYDRPSRGINLAMIIIKLSIVALIQIPIGALFNLFSFKKKFNWDLLCLIKCFHFDVGLALFHFNLQLSSFTANVVTLMDPVCCCSATLG